jgi:NADP-dependent aldehyde dehydrogenase
VSLADSALGAAEAAFASYRKLEPERRAVLLETIAEELLALGDELLTLADRETGLGLPRLTGERGRTVNQLRLFASLVREGSWVDARIDRADPARQPPKPDLRRMLIPLGPIVVFAASNFPFAFSVAGGDTASALAAGNPVVLKAHPAHPETSQRVAAAVARALVRCELPNGVFTLVSGPGYELGLSLVRHPLTRAVAFTGSLAGGRALFDAAAARPEPIPVYAEMGSTNPVFVLPGALAEQATRIGRALGDSATLGTGQFCTKPGLVFACAGPGFDALAQALGAQVASKTPTKMLYPELAERYRAGAARLAQTAGVSELGQAPAGAGTGLGRPLAAQVDVSQFEHSPALHAELFGPSTLLVRLASPADFVRVARALEGQLTATVHGTASDLSQAQPLLHELERKVGRLIFGGVPTGVEVSPAMNHGGPYPASTDSRSTSVGSAAIIRFARPLCYQDAAQSLLPVELRDRNTLGIWRLIGNQLTRDDVNASS